MFRTASFHMICAPLLLLLAACSANSGPVVPGGSGSGSPRAAPDLAEVRTDSTDNLIDVLANDVDGVGGGLELLDVQSVTTVPQGLNGTTEISGNQVRYTPSEGFLGTESLAYTLIDANGNTATSAVIITVLPDVTPPILTPDVFSVTADSSDNVLDILGNDIDLSGSGLTITAVSSMSSLPAGSSGSFSVADDELVYSPEPGFVGAESAEYTVTTGEGAMASGAIVIVVGSPEADVPPVAAPDVFTVSSDSSDNPFDVLANDIDPTAGGLTVTAVDSTGSVPAGSTGSLEISNNQVVYTPAPGFNGAETLAYEVMDTSGATATGAVVVSVLPTDPPPVAVPDTVVVEQNTSNNPIDVLANDIDLSATGLSLTAASSVATLPAGSSGSFSIANDTINYSPEPGFLGVETATYTVTTGAGSVAQGTLTIAVIATLDPEHLPVAVPDSVTLTQDSGTTLVDVLANDIDVAGNGLVITDVQQTLSAPAASHASSISGNQVAFAPAAGFVGVVTLTYTISDGLNPSIATVAITVVPEDLPLDPVALPDSYVIDQATGTQLFDVSSNDVSPSGAALSLTAASLIESLPAASHAIGVNGNQLEFTAPGDFSGIVVISYTITDGSGITNGIASITVNPLGLTPLPLALPDVDTANSIAATPQSYDVLANDIDPAGGGLTLTGASITASVPLNPLIPNPGSVSVSGNEVVYTPTAAYAGTVTITYTGQDSLGQPLTGLLTLTVGPI